MKIFKFVFEGRPKVQKNDLVIYKGKGGRPFVTHSKKLEKVRKEITRSAFEQYLQQGGQEPIDYLCEVKFTFYCTKQWEPDLDNLPAIILDALQGDIVKWKREKIKINQVLADDKLVRFEQSEKIVKGDEKYVGEPRTELEIRRYNPKRRSQCGCAGHGCGAHGNSLQSNHPPRQD